MVSAAGSFFLGKEEPLGTVPTQEKGLWVGCTPGSALLQPLGMFPAGSVLPPIPHTLALLGVTTKQGVLIFPKLFGVFLK